MKLQINYNLSASFAQKTCKRAKILLDLQSQKEKMHISKKIVQKSSK